METAGQILFVFGLVFTIYEVRQKVSVSWRGLGIKGLFGPVMMVLGIFMWLVF